MAGWHQTIIIGNVGRDPEMRYLQSGKAVCNVNVAVNEKHGSGDSRTEETTWYRVALWGDTAENANKLLVKGKQVQIVGKMKPSQAYIDKGGNPAAQLEMTAFSFQLLGSRDPVDEGWREAENDDRSSASVDVDDIPF